MKAEQLYLKLPTFMQNLVINMRGWAVKRRRFNPVFARSLKIYQDSNPAEVDKQRLRFFMKEALNVPYWCEEFERYGVDPDAPDLISEVKKLPILEKNKVKENVESFINENYLQDAFWSTTSGTTGSPLKFPYTYEMENRQWAIWTRYREWHGVTDKTWMGWFGGKVIVNVKQNKSPYWRTNYPMKQVMFSAYHLNKETIHEYFNKIEKARLPWLHGYPSQLALLASLIKEEGLGSLPALKIITIGSESLLDSQRTIMEEVFKVPVRQHYGLAEGVSNISETQDGHLACDQDFCLTEFVGIDEGDVRRIVGTNYNNLAFPLFRYDTGDLATVAKATDGTEYAVSLDGRKDDYILLPNGVKIGRLSHVVKPLEGISASQFYQRANGDLEIRLVVNSLFSRERDEALLLKEARDRLGDEINISIEYFSDLPKTKSGKLRFVISDLT